MHGSSAGIPEARRSGTEVRRGGTEVRRSGTEVRRGALISCEEDLGSSAGGGLKSEMTCFNSKGFETCFQFERLRKGFRKASKGFERLRRVVTYFQFERRRQGGMRIEVNESLPRTPGKEPARSCRLLGPVIHLPTSAKL